MRTGLVLAIAAAAAMAGAPAAADCPDDAIGAARTLSVSVETSLSGRLLKAGEVVLTFDDGPHPRHTRRVLRALAEACAPAVFFLRGDKAARYPKHVRRIARAGHPIGGHGWAHRNLMEMTAAEAEADIQRGLSAIDRALAGGDEGHAPVRLFRFPFVAADDALKTASRDKGRILAWVDVDGQDWTGNSSADIIERILTGLEAKGRKGVVLLHDPFPRSSRAVAPLLDRLKAEGYRLVAVSPAPG